MARKAFKARRGLYNKGLIEDHHVIPRQHAKHPTIKKFDYDMNASSNLVMLPTDRGKEVLSLREGRLVHVGKHAGYNRYVGDILNVITTEEELSAFTEFLKVGCRYRPQDIPWH